MFFVALAADYDGTLAFNGVVDGATVEALQRLKQTGRRLVMVTGRELPDLKRVFEHLSLFDRIVVENGALLYDPASEKETLLTTPPPDAFVRALQERHVLPLSIGRGILATWEPNETIVLDVIRDLGLELQIIFNKGAVMVLPAGVNKATGLAAALAELEISPHNVVGVGDAENDHAFLKACGCSVAVANALPMVKQEADIVTQGARGAGVIELIERIVTVDAGILPPHKNGIAVGKDRDGREVFLEPHRGGTLIAGTSGVGKSTIARALTERMREKGFQFCVFDPEGDYQTLEGAVTTGDAKAAPSLKGVFELLRKLGANVVVNTLATPLEERPVLFAKLVPEVVAFRQRTGRPHWLIIDEAHHVLPKEREGAAQSFPSEMPAGVFITVHPEAMLPHALKGVDVVIALGEHAGQVLNAFCDAVEIERPPFPSDGASDEVLFWSRASGEPPQLIKTYGPKQEHRRHTRKYAEGELGPERSFYFRGPDEKLNLRAHNLAIFLQMAEGVDDPTWEHHLRRGDYSKWFREAIKDDELADEAAAIECNRHLSAAQSRKRVGEAVSKRYTAPAKAEG